MKDNYTENFWITETLQCGYKWKKKVREETIRRKTTTIREI